MEMNGTAYLALLPSGSISGHFIDTTSATSLGIFGSELPCERECSKGEDYRLVDLTILEFSTGKKAHVIVECRGHDAARFCNASHVDGWDTDVIEATKGRARDDTPMICFECEILKSEHDAAQHIRRFLPSLVAQEAVVNIGPMKIERLNLALEDEVLIQPMHDELNEIEAEIKHRRGTCCAESQLRELVEDELEASGLSKQPLEFLWKSNSSGWFSKQRVDESLVASLVPEFS